MNMQQDHPELREMTTAPQAQPPLQDDNLKIGVSFAFFLEETPQDRSTSCQVQGRSRLCTRHSPLDVAGSSAASLQHCTLTLQDSTFRGK